MIRPKLVFLSQEDVIKAGGLDMRQALSDMEIALRLHGQGQMDLPLKTFVAFDRDEHGTYNSATITMPVYVGGDVCRAGVKLAAESITNAKYRDLPMGIDLIVLQDTKRVHPIAIMDGTLITAIRTAAVAGVAIRYLARNDSQVVGLVGAGIVGRATMEMLCHVLPNATEVRLFNKTRDRAEMIMREFSDRLPIHIVDNAEIALRDADICITMTTAKSPFIQGDWISPGSLFAHISQNDVEEEVILQSNCIVVDESKQIRHFKRAPLTSLVCSGKVDEHNISNLGEIIIGKRPGRQSYKERIFFDSYGMACEDIVMAERVYQEAQKLNLGQELYLWHSSWDI